jgi:hypothetical protein
MAKERQGYDEEALTPRSRNGLAYLDAETLRSTDGATKKVDDEPRSERLHIFWRVFGGTLLSIAALVGLTVYNNLSGTLGDLRKEMNQQYESRGELVKKDELNQRSTTLWDSIKDLRAANASLVALSERAKLLDQQQERQMKAADEDRKELHRKLEEVRKQSDDERREYGRKLDEQRKLFDEERKEMSRKLQMLAERLATVEGRQENKSAKPKD